MEKRTITVDAVGKFGVRHGDLWYGVKKENGKAVLELSSFKTGTEYDVLVEAWKPGKFNICQIVAEKGKGKPEGSPERPDPRGDSMKVGGLFHDAAQITAALVMANQLKTADALKTFGEVLDGIVGIRAQFDVEEK